MELEEAMSPLVPQTFQVVEPAESGRQTGSVSEGVLGVSPVVAGAPEISSREPSPAKTPAQVLAPSRLYLHQLELYLISPGLWRSKSRKWRLQVLCQRSPCRMLSR